MLCLWIEAYEDERLLQKENAHLDSKSINHYTIPAVALAKDADGISSLASVNERVAFVRKKRIEFFESIEKKEINQEFEEKYVDAIKLSLTLSDSIRALRLGGAMSNDEEVVKLSKSFAKCQETMQEYYVKARLTEEGVEIYTKWINGWYGEFVPSYVFADTINAEHINSKMRAKLSELFDKHGWQEVCRLLEFSYNADSDVDKTNFVNKIYKALTEREFLNYKKYEVKGKPCPLFLHEFVYYRFLNLLK
jgi:hypothetical protein